MQFSPEPPMLGTGSHPEQRAVIVIRDANKSNSITKRPLLANVDWKTLAASAFFVSGFVVRRDVDAG